MTSLAPRKEAREVAMGRERGGVGEVGEVEGMETDRKERDSRCAGSQIKAQRQKDHAGLLTQRPYNIGMFLYAQLNS